MKKIVVNVIGIALFIAGYHQTRRQADYVSTKLPSTSTTTYVTKPVSFPGKVNRVFALRMTKSV